MEREELIRTVTAAQNGDSEALNTLFNTFYNDVYYFALKTVKDDDLACDITQETFVEIINTLGDLQEPVAFVTWMKKITYHQCTRYFKKKKDVIVDEDEDGNTIFDTLTEERAEFIPDEALDKEDFRQTIMGMIDKLSDEQRAAVMMYYFDELTVKQIAEMQGVSEGTVKSRLNYARKAIKGSVEEYEKKNNVKLHSFAFLPLLLWLFRGYFAETMSTASAQTVAAGVSTATGAAISVSAGTGAAAAVTATATATGIGAKIASIPVVAKVVAGIVAAAIVVGGGLAIADIATPEDETTNPPAIETTLSSENEDNSQTTGVPESDIPIADSFELSAGDRCASDFVSLTYNGMRFFSSPDEITVDEVARLLYGLWAGVGPDNTVLYEAIRADTFDKLCMETFGRTYDKTQLTGQFAEYNQALDAVVMTCGTPFTNIHYTASGIDFEANDGSRFNVVEHWPNTDNATVDDITFRATIILRQVNGYWKLYSILEGDLEDELGVVGEFREVEKPELNANAPVSNGNLRFDGYYYGKTKDENKKTCYLYLRFYSDWKVVSKISYTPLENVELNKDGEGTIGEWGGSTEYFKAVLYPKEEDGPPTKGYMEAAIKKDSIDISWMYNDQDSDDVVMIFVPIA